MYRIGIISLVAFFCEAFAQEVRVQKPDFPRFAGVLSCGTASGEVCPGAAGGFTVHGLMGDEVIPDPSATELTTGGKVLVGFLEGKPFTWPRYSVEFPNSGWKWVVLNELSSNDQNRVFISLWKHTGSSLDLVKVFPRFLPLALGETTVHSKSMLPDGSLLVILKGEGSDAGIGLQDFRFLRLSGTDALEEVYRRTNRSEIPVQAILDRLNSDQSVEAVLDSNLVCEVSRKKAPSGGPLIRFSISRNQVLYTKSGPQETPVGKNSEEVDIWQVIKARKAGRQSP